MNNKGQARALAHESQVPMMEIISRRSSAVSEQMKR